MRRYSYQSCLSPSQIRARLEALTKPAASFGWRVAGDAAFYSRFSKGNRFLLIKTHPGQHGAGAINQLAFLGSLKEDNGQTRITGRFGWEGKRLILYAVILLVLLLMAGSLLTAILTGLLFGLLLFLFTAFSSSMYSQEEEEVRAFIEKHLLS